MVWPFGGYTEEASYEETTEFRTWCKHCRVYVRYNTAHKSRECRFCFITYCTFASSGDHSFCEADQKARWEEADRKRNQLPIPRPPETTEYLCHFCRKLISDPNVIQEHITLRLCTVCNLEHPNCCIKDKYQGCNGKMTEHDVMRANMNMMNEFAKVLKRPKPPYRTYKKADGRQLICPSHICPEPPPPQRMTPEEKARHNRDSRFILFWMFLVFALVIADLFMAYLKHSYTSSLVLVSFVFVMNCIFHILIFFGKVFVICVATFAMFCVCVLSEMGMFLGCSMISIFAECSYEHVIWVQGWTQLVWIAEIFFLPHEHGL